MTKYEIVEQLAKDQVVERVIANICSHRRPEHSDLSQIVYLALLTKPDEYVIRAHEEGWINKAIAAIVCNQMKPHSTFGDLFARHSRRTEELNEQDIAYDPGLERGY